MNTLLPTSITDTEILERVRTALHATFDVDPAQVTPEAQLFTDLGLDSIDAVDLAIQVQEMTGKRIKPDDFRHVRTVGDVIGVVRQLLGS